MLGVTGEAAHRPTPAAKPGSPTARRSGASDPTRTAHRTAVTMPDYAEV